MKIQAQRSAELTQLCHLIENIPVAMLTSVNADGALVSRPMTPLQMDSDGVLWFFIDWRSANADQLHDVNLSFTNPAQATYVSLSGHGEIDVDLACIKQHWTLFARPWFPDGPDSANLAMLKFVPEAAEYWDAPQGKIVRMFAIAASLVAHRPVASGNHDTLVNLSPHSSPSDWSESDKFNNSQRGGNEPNQFKLAV
jgi:general stress protein 26